MGAIFGSGSSATPPPPPPPPPAATPPTYASSMIQGKPRTQNKPFGGTMLAAPDATVTANTATKQLIGQ